ncbi:hypothetical protein NTJ01_003562 [Vibrio cholerae]
MAFLLCVEFGDYGVVRKVGSCVSGYLIGRYAVFWAIKTSIFSWL